MRWLGLVLALASANVSRAELPPLHVEADLTLGMRAGLTGVATTRAWRDLDVGVQVHGITDLYTFAPKTITVGLDAKLNLRLGLLGAVGWWFEGERWSVAVHAMFGPEVFLLKEVNELAALPAPATYATTAVLLTGGIRPSAHWRFADRWGANLGVYFPLPLSGLGGPQIARIAIHLGATWRPN